MREEASNRPPGPWLKTVVLSGVGKGALDVSGRDQEGERKRIANEVSKNIRVTSKPVGFLNWDIGVELGFYAARSYSLMRPPRTGQRLIRCRDGSAAG